MSQRTDFSVFRGDTLELTLNVILNGTAYPIQSGDKVAFTLKCDPTEADSESVIRKSKDDGITVDPDVASIATIKLLPADTAKLKPGKSYPYDVQLTTAGGDVSTLANGFITSCQDVTQDA